jgi:hypothetical protein
MYFANNYYLLRYDGGISIRCPIKLLLDPLVEGDRIYSGSYKEFGYWYRETEK